MGVRTIHIDDGIDQHGDIRAAIGCVMGCRGAREVSAGAEAEDSDFPEAHRAGLANRFLRIEQRCRVAIPLRSEAVGYDECGQAEGVEPLRDGLAFMRGVATVAATRANHDCIAIWLRRLVNRERRNGIFAIIEGKGHPALRPQALCLHSAILARVARGRRFAVRASGRYAACRRSPRGQHGRGVRHPQTHFVRPPSPE